MARSASYSQFGLAVFSLYYFLSTTLSIEESVHEERSRRIPQGWIQPLHSESEVAVQAMKLMEGQDSRRTSIGSLVVRGAELVHPTTVKGIVGKGEVIVGVEDEGQVALGTFLMLHLWSTTIPRLSRMP